MTIYYLPTRETDTPAISLAASRWSVLRARTYRAWSRLRLTATEVWGVVRRGGQRPSFHDHIVFTDDVLASRRRALGPARIIDLDAARRRRAPAALSARA
jgi:hypothetical protein